MKPIEIANIWKSLKGTYNEKASDLCNEIGLQLSRLPRQLHWKNGDTDGYEIRTKSIRDKFDLFTLFHEIGHTQLHWNGQDNPVYDYDAYMNTYKERENEADNFACEVMRTLYGSKIENTLRVCMI